MKTFGNQHWNGVPSEVRYSPAQCGILTIFGAWFLIILSFIGGGFAGYSAATWSTKEQESAGVAKSAAAAIVYNRGVLNSIEKGDTTHAMRQLRSYLTVQTMLLDRSLRELPPNPKYTNLFKIFEQSKDEFGPIYSPHDVLRMFENAKNQTNRQFITTPRAILGEFRPSG